MNEARERVGLTHDVQEELPDISSGVLRPVSHSPMAREGGREGGG